MALAASGAYNVTSASRSNFPTGVGMNENADSPMSLFGPQVGQIAPSPYDRIARTNLDVADAFANQAIALRDTITGLITDASSGWETTICAPWVFTNDMHVVFNTWEFNGTLAGRVPSEGISRLITSSKRSQRRSVVRRGLAFMMEQDYFNTAEGIVQYERNITGIADCVQHTQEHDTIYELLTCNNYERMWEYKFGKSTVPYKKMLDDEIANFGCITMDDTRLEILYFQNDRLMRKNQVIPDLLITPPGTSIYLTQAQPMKTLYYTVGEGGVRLQKEGPQALTSFKTGVPIVETKDFEVNTGPAVELLTRPVYVSERYEMVFGVWRRSNIEGYNTGWRDTYLYDENTDAFKKILFRDAFLNSKLFEINGNDYHPELQELIKKYNTDRRVPSRGSAESEYDGTEKPSKLFPEHFLSASDSENQFMLIKYFGQMDMKSATISDFEQVGKTIISYVFGNDEKSHVWTDLIGLINQIESQPYEERYWRAVIQANLPFSINEKDQFTGKRTPSDLVETWGQASALIEWSPNSYGSLMLPQDVNGNLNGVEFPSGFANAPGLLTLANEAEKKTSKWQGLGIRARKIVQFLRCFVDRLLILMPTSECLDPGNRSPWFHREDPLTAFFETIVSVQRDPVWMAHLAPLTTVTERGERRVSGDTFGEVGSSSENDLSWFVTPLFVVPLPDSVENTSSVIDRLKDLYGDNPYTTDSKTYSLSGKNVFSYKSLLTNAVVEIPPEYLKYTQMISKEFKAMMLMGQYSIEALRSIFSAMDDPSFLQVMSGTEEKKRQEVQKTKLKLIDFIYNFNISNDGSVAQEKKFTTRKVVLSLVQEISNPEVLYNTINTIYVTSSSNQTKKNAAKKRIAELANGSVVNDFDIPEFKDQKFLLQPKDVDTLKAGREAISFEPIATKVYEVSNLVGIVNATRKYYGRNPKLAFSFNPESPLFIEWSKYELTDANSRGVVFDKMKQEHDDNVQKVVTLVLEIKQYASESLRLSGDKEWLDQAENVVQRRRKSAVVVDDQQTAGIRSRFYRSPLTMSLELLRSMSAEGPECLIRPSDPTTSHMTAYITNNPRDDNANILPENIYKRPNYMGIGSISGDPNVRKLSVLPFVSIHIAGGKKRETEGKRIGIPTDSEYPTEKRGFIGGKEGSKKRYIREDEEDEECEDEDSFERALRKIPKQTMSDDVHPKSWSVAELEKRHRGRRPNDMGGVYSEKLKYIKTDTFEKRINQSNAISKPILRAAVQAFMLAKSTKDQWLRFIDNNIHVLVNIILWRPFIEHNMSSMILMKAGVETGANLYGNSNFSTGNDVITKMIYGNFTFQSKCIVWKPKNVAILENVKPNGYCGGNGTKFMTRQKDISDTSVDRASLLATAVPITENDFEWVMSLTGYLDIPNVNPEIDGCPKLTYTTAEYYDRIWKLSQLSKQSSPGLDDFFSRIDRVTIRAMQGLQIDFNKSSGVFDRVTLCKGHMKNGCYPGAAGIWQGSVKYHKQYDFSCIKLE
jgi:hypothetical protein